MNLFEHPNAHLLNVVYLVPEIKDKVPSQSTLSNTD